MITMAVPRILFLMMFLIAAIVCAVERLPYFLHNPHIFLGIETGKASVLGNFEKY